MPTSMEPLIRALSEQERYKEQHKLFKTIIDLFEETHRRLDAIERRLDAIEAKPFMEYGKR